MVDLSTLLITRRTSQVSSRQVPTTIRGCALSLYFVDQLTARQIVLLGHVFDIDIQSRQVTISWLVIGCGGLRMPNAPDYYGVKNCGRPSVGANFFVDG